MNADINRYLKRMEKMVDQLLAVRFSGGQDFWDYQLKLLQLQRDIRTEVSRAQASSTDADSNTLSLQDWQELRWRARRLGDAFAWLILGLDRRSIFPLAENRRVPIPPDDAGSRGVLALAQHLSAEGWGFPLLHDVTDTLRIGDVTFVRPEFGRFGLRTVEVKTSVEETTTLDDGQRQESLTVTIVHHTSKNATGEELLPVEVQTPSVSVRRPQSRTMRNPRVQRQLGRMADALVRQTAREGEVFRIADKPWITTTVEEIDTHWDVLRRVIRQARKAGYASQSVDGAFLYVALFSESGIGDGDPWGATTLSEDLLTSQILIPESPERNSLIVHSVPEVQKHQAVLSLPFFLYPIPRRAVQDMLYGRLIVVVLANPGRIAEAIEREGLSVRIREGDGEDSPLASLIVTTEVTHPDGGVSKVELHNVGHTLHEAIREFQSLASVVGRVKAMTAVGATAYFDPEESHGL